ncbi:MAG: hypothetical protein ACRDOK_07790 [Streptosporangiaceae bacterium]
MTSWPPPEDVRAAAETRGLTHFEDVNARLIDMVADQLLARAFGVD